MRRCLLVWQATARGFGSGKADSPKGNDRKKGKNDSKSKDKCKSRSFALLRMTILMVGRDGSQIFGGAGLSGSHSFRKGHGMDGVPGFCGSQVSDARPGAPAVVKITSFLGYLTMAPVLGSR